MDYTSLCCVVRRLELGNVDNVSAHARRSNEAAVAEVFQPSTVDVGSLLLLPSPVDTGSSSAIEGPVQVSCDYSSIMIDRAVQGRSLGPWNSCIGDKDIETTIEIVDDVVDQCLNIFRVGRIALVSSA